VSFLASSSTLGPPRRALSQEGRSGPALLDTGSPGISALTELESELAMTRFGVMKHLRVLADAGLVVTRRSGRHTLHFLNPVPIRLIHDRWIDKYTAGPASALADLKRELEEGT
jgi:DNA-binding transcriptional ArsR family regulator